VRQRVPRGFRVGWDNKFSKAELLLRLGVKRVEHAGVCIGPGTVARRHVQAVESPELADKVVLAVVGDRLQAVVTRVPDQVERPPIASSVDDTGFMV
jgi:hypothetical protein